MCVAILYDPACMGAAILDDGSLESPAILELGKVVANASLQIMGCVLLLCGHCTSQVICATGSLGRALVLKVMDWGPRVTI